MKKFPESQVKLFTILIFLIFSSMLANARPTGPVIKDTVTFQVNMKYMIANSSFNPATDTIDIFGAVNQWQGGDFLHQVDSSTIYEIRMELSQSVIYSYRYRIHKAQQIIAEQVDTITRMIRVPDTLITVTRYFNNNNPATVPMTFNCNMYYMVRSGHFIPFTDFVDVAGNFNHEGGNDVLFSKGNDSIFSLTTFLDTTLIGTPLKFKFRINGNWATSELQGDSSRVYMLTGTADSYTAWYNNIDPTIPALPFVHNVMIQDTIQAKRTITGSYQYEDYNLKPEGNSHYQWYTADSIGGVVTAITSANLISYTIDSLFLGKYLAFEVTPLTTDSIVGVPVRVYSAGKITGVGIEEKNIQLARVYPNPVHDILTIEPLVPVVRANLVDISGRIVRTHTGLGQTKIRINVEGLTDNFYFLNIYGKRGGMNTFKVIVR